MRDWIRAFANAAKERRYVLGTATTTAVLLWDHVSQYLVGRGMTGLLGFPSWVVGIWVAAAFVIYWLLARLVVFERRTKGARFELARLRTEGVALRNEALMQLSAGDWALWQMRATEWNRKTTAEIRKISEGYGEWFSVLDVVPPPRLPSPHQTGNSADPYAMHDCRLRRLGKMIYELWQEQ